METIKNLKPLFTAVLLIIAGLVSSSNGFDDRTYKTPLETLTIVCSGLLAAVTVYLIWNFAEKTTKSTKLRL